MAKEYGLVLHGGAGTLVKDEMTAEKERMYRSALLRALSAGEEVLKNNGDALDAVIVTVKVLEQEPLFNAGVGAVMTHEGVHELDASLMEGKERKAAAVCAVRRIESPISLCRMVMDSEFVMLNGEGAEQFAKEQGVPVVSNSHFTTTLRKEQLEEAKKNNRVQLDHTDNREKYGTVGAVAIDKNGTLAAATSTGGMTNKRYGRIGDSALIGSGTWADNRNCAVSATGYGEFFIRSAVASRIASMMEYGGLSLADAGFKVINHEVGDIGGDGGVISIDKDGNIACPFNSEGMYRAWVKEGTPLTTAIFTDDAVAHE